MDIIIYVLGKSARLPYSRGLVHFYVYVSVCYNREHRSYLSENKKECKNDIDIF